MQQPTLYCKIPVPLSCPDGSPPDKEGTLVVNTMLHTLHENQRLTVALHWIILIYNFLADPGEARGCSGNTVVMN